MFIAPDGHRVDKTGARPPLSEPVAALEHRIGQLGVRIDAHTNAPGFDGWPIDYAMCVGALTDARSGA